VTTPSERTDAAVVLRPYWARIFAYIAALVIAAAQIAVGFLLKIESTGVIFQTADQVAMAVLGLVIAGGILLFARPRLRIDSSAIYVRNLLGEKVIAWGDVVGVSFPLGSRWARIDLPDDEYVPVLAIQAVDRDRAVAGMDTLRSMLARYRPDLRARGQTPK